MMLARGGFSLFSRPVSRIAACAVTIEELPAHRARRRGARDFEDSSPRGRNAIHREAALLKEFKEFAMRGNVVDLAVGIIIGGAFGTIVKSLVDDVIMPPIGLLLGGVDFSNLFMVLRQGTPTGPYASLADAKTAGAVSINYGVFLNSVITFLIVAFAVFLLIRAINTLRRKEEAAPPPPSAKECPFCASTISVKATRCPSCTSQLAA